MIAEGIEVAGAGPRFGRSRRDLLVLVGGRGHLGKELVERLGVEVRPRQVIEALEQLDEQLVVVAREVRRPTGSG